MFKKNFFENIHKIFKLVGLKTSLWLSLGIIGSLISGFVDVGIAVFLQVFLKVIGLLPGDAPTLKYVTFINPTLENLAFSLVVIGLVRSLGQFLTLQTPVVAQENIVARLRYVLIYKILLNKKEEFTASSLSNYYLGSIFQNTGIFCFILSQVITYSIQSSLLVIFMFTIAWKEAAVSMIGLLFIGISMLIVTKIIRKKSQIIPSENKRLIEGIERISRNWLLVKIFKTQKEEYLSFYSAIRTILKNIYFSSWLNSSASALAPFFGIILILVIIYLSQSQFQTEGANLLTFLYLNIRFVQGLSQGVNSMGYLNQYLPHFKESYNLFYSLSHSDREEALSENNKNLIETQHRIQKNNNRSAQSPTPDIHVKDLSYSYKDKEMFESLNFTIVSGCQFAIIGESGVGKSTLLRLILGFERPLTKGSILINSIDSKNYFEDHKRRIGYVGAEPFLIAGTLLQNLTYGLDNVDENKIWEALKRVKMYDYVRSLNKQLDFLILENGDGLSAGQKQRICLARAFLAEPELLILDEATANLDLSTEEDIVQEISKYKNKCTTLIVSHRASTIKYADYTMTLKGKNNYSLIKIS